MIKKTHLTNGGLSVCYVSWIADKAVLYFTYTVGWILQIYIDSSDTDLCNTANSYLTSSILQLYVMNVTNHGKMRNLEKF